MSTTTRESGLWDCRFTIEKFWGPWLDGRDDPYEVLQFEHNTLAYGGTSNLWQYALGNGTTTAGHALTYLNAANAAVGVGDSNVAAAAAQTDLQAATNKLRKGMASGYPAHTPGTGSGAKTITFRSTFDTTEANFAWEEAAVFNSATAGTGRMLNRKVTSMGTKTSASSWQITIDVWID